MPSGAKKRKAAKKKLQKEAYNNGSHSHSHSQGNDDPKPRNNRESDGGVVKVGEKFNDVTVVGGDGFEESHRRNVSEEDKSSSNSSSSSEDDEVKVDKEKLGQGSLREVALSNETHEPAGCVTETRSGENPVNVEVVYDSIDGSVPVEDAVKEVVSLPQESNLSTVAETVPSEHSTTSDMVESRLEQNMNEILQLSNEQDNASSMVYNSSGKSSQPVDITRRDSEGLLPKYTGLTIVDRDGNNDQFQESEKHNYSEEQPLVSTAPLSVRRTSWMNCCGLFDVLSGGSSR